MTIRVIIAGALILTIALVAYALPTWIGCAAEPADGDQATSPTYSYVIDGQTAPAAGEVTQIQCYPAGYSGTIEFAVMSKSGSDFTDEQYTGQLIIDAFALFTYNAPADFTAMPIAVGEYIGYFIDGGGTLEKISSGGTGYWFAAGDDIGDDDAGTFNLSGNTTHDIQFRFYITATGAGPQMNTSTNASFGSIDNVEDGKIYGMDNDLHCLNRDDGDTGRRGGYAARCKHHERRLD